MLAGAASTESREWESCSSKSGAGRGGLVISQVETEGRRGAVGRAGESGEGV